MKVWTRPLRSRAVVAAIAAGAVGVGACFAASSAAGSDVAIAAVDDLPPFAVEDFNYPRAAEIEAERGFLLKRGDGHIVLADCGSQDNLLQIYARNQPSQMVCFRVTGSDGYLTLELPAVLGVRTNDYETTTLDLTVGDEQSSVEVDANTFEAIGETADPEGREHVLVEVRVEQ
jgi:hypothetical protein